MVREPFSIGKTTPSEIAKSTIAMNNGDSTKAARPKGDSDQDRDDE
jgi:hypothetical protein